MSIYIPIEFLKLFWRLKLNFVYGIILSFLLHLPDKFKFLLEFFTTAIYSQMIPVGCTWKALLLRTQSRRVVCSIYLCIFKVNNSFWLQVLCWSMLGWIIVCDLFGWTRVWTIEIANITIYCLHSHRPLHYLCLVHSRNELATILQRSFINRRPKFYFIFLRNSAKICLDSCRTVVERSSFSISTSTVFKHGSSSLNGRRLLKKTRLTRLI